MLSIKAPILVFNRLYHYHGGFGFAVGFKAYLGVGCCRFGGQSGTGDLMALRCCGRSGVREGMQSEVEGLGVLSDCGARESMSVLALCLV